MQTLWLDLKYALRMLAKSPAFLIVSLVSLALGIGGNTAIFTVVKAVFLSPINIRDPNNVVSIGTRDDKLPNTLPLSYLNFEDYRERQNVFQGMSLINPAWLSVSIDSGSLENWSGEIVSGNFFEVLGVSPAAGRIFNEKETRVPGEGAYAVISYSLWAKRFGADASVLNDTVVINRRPFTVIGVMPKGFRGINLMSDPDVWLPLSMAPLVMSRPEALKERKALYFFAFGRLKQGVTRDQAQQAMMPIAAQLANNYPLDNGGRSIKLAPLTETIINPEYRTILERASVLMMTTVALVLLIACANVAALLLVRARMRNKEFAIRLAVGAGVGRIIRQMLTESILLSMGGGALGLLVAKWARDILWQYRPPWLSGNALDLNLDRGVLLFTFGMSLFTGVLFGLAPAMNAWRRDLVTELKERSGQAARERHFFGMRNVLVMGQCALSIIALIAAGLFLENLRRLREADTGMDHKRLALLMLNIGTAGYNKDQGLEFYRQAAERVRALPSVKSASLSSILPMSTGGYMRTYYLQGQDLSARGPMVLMNAVGTRYFETAGIRLREGREFHSSDREKTQRVVIVNEAMAKNSWPNQNAIGKQVRFADDPGWREVVGVAANSKFFSLGEEPMACVYIPVEQEYLASVTLIANVAGDPRKAAGPIAAEIAKLDRKLLLPRVMALEELLDRSLWAQRTGASLLSVFGLLGLLLAAFGIYGLTSYTVTQRTAEIGLRMALGAEPYDVLRFIVRQVMTLVIPGLAIGLAAAAVCSKFVGSLLYGVTALHPPAYLLAIVLLISVALLACVVPARRATKVDPLIALRQE